MIDQGFGKVHSAGFALACCLAVLLIGPAYGGDNVSTAAGRDDPVDEGNGAIPLSPEEFAKLPKTASYRAYLPERVDLSRRFPTPGNQGAIGSCTAWAVGYAARGYYAGAAEGRNVADLSNIPSPSYIYGAIAADPAKCSSGSKIVDALDLLHEKGAPSFRVYPFERKTCRAPTPEQRARASDFKIAEWLSVDFTHIDQLKGELAKGHPVIVSFRDTTAFHHLRGTDIYKSANDTQVGWHALVFVGYDEARQAFRVINSWGQRWADHGFGWIAYSIVPTAVREAYVMRPLAPVPDPPGPVALVRPPLLPPSPRIDKRMPLALSAGCEKLSMTATEKGEISRITGYTDSKARLSQQQPKLDISQVQERPWPQCEVLQTLGERLFKGDRPIVEVRSVSDKGKGNAHIEFVVETPDYPSFLHIAYLQADGSVVNLLQPSSVTLHAYPPKSKLVLGDPATGGPTFHVSKPFGREMLVATSSRSPLFDSQLPSTQSAREFLTDLRKALIARPDTSAPERFVTAGFDSVITSEKGIVLVPAPPGM